MRGSEQRQADRLEALVRQLLAGRRPHLEPSDAPEGRAIMAAARLAGARQAFPRPGLEFKRRLAAELGGSLPPAGGGLSRRAALVAGAGVAVGALGGVGAQRVADLLPKPTLGPTKTAAEREILEPHPETARWYDTGIPFAEMSENQPQRVTAGAISAFVIRQGEQLTAMSSYCTHQPCQLVPAGSQLRCPCHNLSFSLKGESLADGYDLPSLPLVRVRVKNGRVEVMGTS